MEATLAALQAVQASACSDLGAAGLGAGVCESARYGGFGARVDLSKVPLKVDTITPEEILICETQARMLIQVAPNDVEAAMDAIRSQNGVAAVIGEITGGDSEVFVHEGKTVAVIPNRPPAEVLAQLDKGR